MSMYTVYEQLLGWPTVA